MELLARDLAVAVGVPLSEQVDHAPGRYREMQGDVGEMQGDIGEIQGATLGTGRSRAWRGVGAGLGLGLGLGIGLGLGLGLGLGRGLGLGLGLGVRSITRPAFLRSASLSCWPTDLSLASSMSSAPSTREVPWLELA